MEIKPPEIEGWFKNIICPFCGGCWEQVVPELSEDKSTYFKCAGCSIKVIIQYIQ